MKVKGQCFSSQEASSPHGHRRPAAALPTPQGGCDLRHKDGQEVAGRLGDTTQPLAPRRTGTRGLLPALSEGHFSSHTNSSGPRGKPEVRGCSGSVSLLEKRGPAVCSFLKTDGVSDTRLPWLEASDWQSTDPHRTSWEGWRGYWGAFPSSPASHWPLGDNSDLDLANKTE